MPNSSFSKTIRSFINVLKEEELRCAFENLGKRYGLGKRQSEKFAYEAIDLIQKWMRPKKTNKN